MPCWGVYSAPAKNHVLVLFNSPYLTYFFFILLDNNNNKVTNDYVLRYYSDKSVIVLLRVYIPYSEYYYHNQYLSASYSAALLQKQILNPDPNLRSPRPIMHFASCCEACSEPLVICCFLGYLRIFGVILLHFPRTLIVHSSSTTMYGVFHNCRPRFTSAILCNFMSAVILCYRQFVSLDLLGDPPLGVFHSAWAAVSPGSVRSPILEIGLFSWRPPWSCPWSCLVSDPFRFLFCPLFPFSALLLYAHVYPRYS